MTARSRITPQALEAAWNVARGASVRDFPPRLPAAPRDTVVRVRAALNLANENDADLFHKAAFHEVVWRICGAVASRDIAAAMRSEIGHRGIPTEGLS